MRHQFSKFLNLPRRQRNFITTVISRTRIVRAVIVRHNKVCYAKAKYANHQAVYPGLMGFRLNATLEKWKKKKNKKIKKWWFSRAYKRVLPKWQSFVLTAHREREREREVRSDRYTCPCRSSNVPSWTGQFAHQAHKKERERERERDLAQASNLSLVLLITAEVCRIYLFNVPLDRKNRLVLMNYLSIL